jgi:hypothetical protein
MRADRLPGTILPPLPALQIRPGHTRLVDSLRMMFSRSCQELGTITQLGKHNLVRSDPNGASMKPHLGLTLTSR